MHPRPLRLGKLLSLLSIHCKPCCSAIQQLLDQWLVAKVVDMLEVWGGAVSKAGYIDKNLGS